MDGGAERHIGTEWCQTEQGCTDNQPAIPDMQNHEQRPCACRGTAERNDAFGQLVANETGHDPASHNREQRE